MSSFENAIHWISEFLISFAFELPCAFTTRPFRPRSGAPPYSLASKLFSVSFSAGFTRSAPILLRRLDIIPAFTLEISVEPTPSYSFRITFPTNASQTTTSQTPFGISLASTFPIKLMSLHSFNNGNVSFTSAFPFSSSAPIFTRPTFGFLTPMTYSM